MNNKRAAVCLCFILTLGHVIPAAAAVESRTLRELAVEGTPIDVALSGDGQSIFILTDKGVVLIYGFDGTLKEKLTLGEPADQIAVSPRGDALIVASREKKTARVVLLEYVRNINISGAPSKGPQDAPVTVAVFTDYQ